MSGSAPYIVGAYKPGLQERETTSFSNLEEAERGFDRYALKYFPEQVEWKDAESEVPAIVDQYSEWLLLLHKKAAEFCIGHFYQWEEGEEVDLIQYGRDGYRLTKADYYWKRLPKGEDLLALIKGEKPAS